MNLKCISLNIRGINKSIKRRNLFRWLHNGKYDVIFLQETYSDDKIENIWRAEWGGDVFYSHGSKHSRGVMLLIKPTFKIENPDIIRNKKGGFFSFGLRYKMKNFVLSTFTLQMIQVSKKRFSMNCLTNCDPTLTTISSLVAISTARLKVSIRREEKIQTTEEALLIA